MPHAGVDDLVVSTKKHLFLNKATATAEGSGYFHSTWQNAAAGEPAAGAAPGSINGVIPTAATTGALPFDNAPAGEEARLYELVFTLATAGSFFLVDRVWHNSAINCNIATSQAISQPALTRYTSGEGLELWGECYSAWGAGAFTLTVIFVDDTGTSRTTTYAWPANAPTVGQCFKIPLGAGVTGIRSVTSVQLSAGSGSVGNLGLFLAKRLSPQRLCAAGAEVKQDWIDLGLEEIEDNACLHGIVLCSTTATGAIQANAVVSYR